MTTQTIADRLRGNMWHVAKDRTNAVGVSHDGTVRQVPDFLTTRQLARFREASLVLVRFANPPPWGGIHERYAQVLFIQEASDPTLPLVPELIGIDQ